MKAFTALTVALCALLVHLPELQGAPSQLQRARLQRLYTANRQQQLMSRYTAQLQQQQPGEKMEGIAKSEGIEIEGCGVAGDIVQAAVGWLGIFYPSAFDLYLQCGSPCTIVTVQAPAGTTQADIDVCVDPGSGNTCVTVYAAPPCQPSIFALPISLQIPVGSSQVPVTLKLDIFGSQSCVAVEYNAPLCP